MIFCYNLSRKLKVIVLHKETFEAAKDILGKKVDDQKEVKFQSKVQRKSKEEEQKKK